MNDFPTQQIFKNLPVDQKPQRKDFKKCKKGFLEMPKKGERG
jgi:hypothetical protein